MKKFKSKIYTAKSEKEGNKKAFEIINKCVKEKPDLLIALAVGKTTDGLHELISKDCKKNPNKWKKIKVFQLDENLGLSPNSKSSFNYEIKNELKNLFNVLDKKNIFLINGKNNPKKTIKKAYEFLNKNGGIDLITLGIGPEHDAHIAYNTCRKSSMKSKMRVVKLHPKIAEKLHIKDHAPTHGITLGISDILNAKKAILLAYGANKKKSLELAFNGKINLKKSTASALQLHKNLTIILDRDANWN